MVLVRIAWPFREPVTRICFMPPSSAPRSGGICAAAPPPTAASMTLRNRIVGPGSGIDAVDLSAQCDELGLDLLVPTIDVLDAGDHRCLLRRQGSQHQRRTGP